MRAEAERMAGMVTQLLILARSGAAVAAAHEPILLEDIVVEVCRQRHPADSEPTLECRGMESLEWACVLPNIFDRFYRAENARSQSGAG